MKLKTSRNLRVALVAVLTAALFLSVAALAAVPMKGKPGHPGKGKNKGTPSASQYQYGPSGHQYGKVTLCHKPHKHKGHKGKKHAGEKHEGKKRDEAKNHKGRQGKSHKSRKHRAGKTITVGARAAKWHLRHGDTLGACR